MPTVRDVMGIYFMVQSPGKCCEHITESVNKHLDSMKQEAEELEDEDFEQTVSAVQTNLQEKDKSIKEVFDRFWAKEFTTHKLTFDRQDKMCEIIKTIKKEEW